MICWSIWSSRNELIWEGKRKGNSQILQGELNLFTNWLAATETYQPSSATSSPLLPWQKPQLGYLKYNVDAATFNGRTGFGFVLRDHAGLLFQQLMDLRRLRPHTEAMGLRETLSWLKANSHCNVLELVNVSVPFVARSVNRVAHVLPRASDSVSGLKV
ncbi:conserved hypothetical protein [Ricinus communis]|uniref:RNase H type-1 domain-containing protein n=1 Tax=Ricinus communis TaxID=3988 RepID=B9SN99_RICCO|nr:conserved hypothetical protein [Ricinus communis]